MVEKFNQKLYKIDWNEVCKKFTKVAKIHLNLMKYF